MNDQKHSPAFLAEYLRRLADTPIFAGCDGAIRALMEAADLLSPLAQNPGPAEKTEAAARETAGECVSGE